MTIEEIRERAEKATPGPWAYGEFKTADRPDGALLIGPKFKSTKSGVMYRVEDANFITHAREDIPALLAEIDRLIKEKAQIYEKIEFELKPRIYELEERLEPLEELTYNYATGKDDGSLLTAYVKNALSKI